MNILKFNSYLPKLIEYFLYLIIFLLPLQTRWIIKYGELNNRPWEYGTISLYLVDIMLILLITLFFFDYFLGKKYLKLTKNRKIISLWVVAGLLELAIIGSIFVSPNKLLAIFGYWKFLVGIILFFLLIYAQYNFTKLILVFLVGVFLQAGLGIWQFLTQSSFASKWLGMALHDPTQPGTSVIETLGSIVPGTFILQGERWLRAYGGLDHPNILGGLLALSILLTLIFFIRRSKFEIWDYSNIFEKKYFDNIQFFILHSSFFIAVTALFFTFSRAAWLGLILGWIYLFIIVIYKKQEEFFKKLFAISAVSLLLIIILFSQFSNLVLTRLEANARLEVKSTQERLTSFKEALGIIKDNWFWGVGIGNYTLYAQQSDVIKKPNWSYQPVHNTFLLTWAEIGILGLLAFCALIIWVARLALVHNPYYLSIIIVIITIMLFDHWFWSLHFGVLLFWFALGIIMIRCSINN